MKKLIIKGTAVLLIVTLVFGCVSISSFATGESETTGNEVSPYIVEFKSENYADEFSQSENDAVLLSNSLVSVSLSLDSAAELSQNINVNRIEEDYIVKANTEPDDETEAVEALSWSSKAVGAEYAQNIGETGESVKVAVMDSGLDIYSEIDACGGVDFVDPEYCCGDDLTGHGTAVSGIIAAPVNEEGVIGIAPDAGIYVVRVLDSSNESPISRIISGIDWCIEQNIDIINMSFGTESYSELLEEKIEEAEQAGIIMISSAGNGESIEYPAKFDEVIAVGSVTSSMTKSESSAAGQEIEFAAPGENVFTTSLIGGYGAFSGTSIAAPHITGAAAVLLGKDKTKSPEFIRALLAASCKNLGETQSYGNGLPDIGYALQIYDEFAANYTDDTYTPPQNSGNVTTYENEDVYVVGQWSTEGHNGLAENYFNETDYNNRFPKFIKAVSYACDDIFKNSRLLHGSGNYIVTAKLLFEIARNYKTEGVSNFTHVNYRSDLKSLLGTSNYNALMNDITIMMSEFDSTVTSCDITLNGYENIFSIAGATNFISVSQKTATIVYGMFFHLIGDIYAHRSIVSPSSVNVTNAKSHGGGDGQNKGLYFVKSDFCTNCGTHVASASEKIDKEYTENLDELYYKITELNGYKKVFAFFNWFIYLFTGKNELREKYKSDTETKQIDLDKSLLNSALNIPSNTLSGKMCYSDRACYGSLIRLAGLGVLQFKDIKYFLNGYDNNSSLQTQEYKINQKYYEDRAGVDKDGNIISNRFYNRRYLAVTAVTKQYFEDYYASVAGGTIKIFLPYKLLPLSEENGTNIKHYCIKLDQYYNYLKDFDSGSSVLKRSTWSGTGYSLFNFTTILYNGTYFWICQ